MRAFIDTNVPMYAAGSEHPLRKPALNVLEAVATGSMEAVTDAEVLQELLHRYCAIGKRDKAFKLFDTFAALMQNCILPVTPMDMKAARSFLERYIALSPRDCVHLAVMQTAGVEAILTADRGFALVKGIRFLNLADF